MPTRPLRFCDDAMLNYASSRRVFKPGDTLEFDTSYRLTHLPLVAPRHPAVIGQTPNEDYRNGRYIRPRYSLVVPVRPEALTASLAFQAMEREMRAVAEYAAGLR